MQVAKTEEHIQNLQMVHKLQEQNSQLESMVVKARVDIEVKSAENLSLEQQVSLFKNMLICTFKKKVMQIFYVISD